MKKLINYINKHKPRATIQSVRILICLKDEADLTVTDICHRIENPTYNSVRNNLIKLWDLGLVKKTTNRRNEKRWTLTKAARRDKKLWR